MSKRTIIPWVRCKDCDDYLCKIHVGLHAHECSCPSIDVWVEHGLYPYDRCSVEALKKLPEWDGEA